MIQEVKRHNIGNKAIALRKFLLFVSNYNYNVTLNKIRLYSNASFYTITQS